MLCIARSIRADHPVGLVNPCARWIARRSATRDGTTSRDVRPPTAVALEHWKRPRRGGQNLSDRYRRLERSLREKASLTEFIGDLPGDTAVSSPPGREVHPVHRPSGTVKTFRGLVIPEEPKPPAADECCMSGCAVCVYDLYEESLQAYNASLNALRSTLRAWNVPESEWPASIRDAGDAAKESEGNKTKNVTLSAFEELEKMLQQKRAGT